MHQAHHQKLHVLYVSVSDLKPDPRNARAHSDRQIKQIKRSIETFGFVVPILIDKQGKVIAGHGRLAAAILLGMDEVPVIGLDHLSEAQARALMIADNRLTEISTWNDQLLGEQLKELSALDLDFDLEVIGFTMGEIDLRIEGLDSKPNAPDDADQVPPPPHIPVTAPGDLWECGRHRIYCGNSLDETSFKTLMKGTVAHLVFTDPPYNVPIEGNVSGKGTKTHGDFLMASGEMSPNEFIEFLVTVMVLLGRHSAKGSVHYFCMDWRHLLEISTAGGRAYEKLLNLCVWIKHNGGMGSFYRSRHELIFVFVSGKAAHRNNIQLGRFGRNRDNVWSYPGISNFGRQGEEGDLLKLHPTVKPVALVADAILDASARGDVVLDPFLGSGSTLIAAERVGRICYGVELDPRYVDVAIQRWQVITGERAIHAKSSLSFDEIKSQSR